MSGRTMTSLARDAFHQLNFPAIMLVEMQFKSGTVRVCNAPYTFKWNGFDWFGLGELGGVEGIQEGADLQMYGCGLTLSAVHSEAVSEVLDPTDYQGQPVTIWLAPLNPDYSIIADPVATFKGRMDTAGIVLGDTATITIPAESRLVDWDRPRVRRYNNADQQAVNPGDNGMRYVEQMVSRELKWGRP